MKAKRTLLARSRCDLNSQHRHKRDQMPYVHSVLICTTGTFLGKTDYFYLLLSFDVIDIKRGQRLQQHP
ncbi:Hypothetical predicted protein [Octopus vulgaris]|uniref:Uncharacterized protein n=1 Tax=Octopus vulgaris TaxID=6645 RepID=A0AA36FEX8_OCTVU|nr:Hypothetical predicted protein [Octopus vulgaris]